jgi:competence protein ComEC
MDWWLLNFLLGAILSLFLPIVPAIFYVIITIILAICFSCLKSTRKVSGLFFGGAWLLVAGMQYQNSLVDNSLTYLLHAQKPILLQGEVITLPSKKINRSLLSNISKNSISSTNKNTPLFDYRFNFKIVRVDQKLLNRPIIVRLSWRKSSADIYQGQHWQFQVKMKPAHGFANPGGFSYQTWLRSKNIVATGYVRADKRNKMSVRSTNNKLLIEDLSLRQYLLKRLKPLIPKHELSSLLLALSFGDRSEISTKLWRVLQVTGTQHLIAISGLHLGLVASGTFFILLLVLSIMPFNYIARVVKFKGQSQSFLLRHNSRTWVVIISSLFALYYAYLAGFALPTIRALSMLLLYWGVRLIGIRLSLTRWLLMALCLMVITTPFSLFSSSFWLSIYAVIIIFFIVWRFAYLFKKGGRISQFITSLLVIQLSLSLFMLPIAALFNHQLSVVALFANIIAVPFMSITSIPLSLLAVIFLPLSESISTLLLQLSLKCLDVIWLWLEYLSVFDWASYSISTEQIFALALFILITAVCIFLSINRKYFIVLILALSTLSTAHYFTKQEQGANDRNWQVKVMDVGQGLSVFIERNGHYILYDTAASYPSGFNLADAVLLPYLKHKGIVRLDKVIISHSDNDHAGGLKPLKQSIIIDELISNDINLLPDVGCKRGQTFNWQGLTFKVLWPVEIMEKKQKNDDSCVINISDGKFSVLLTGDISKKVEKQLHKNDSLTANILIAPHHGSKTSSSNKFLQAVQPQFAVFSTGYLNRWRMPAQQIVEKYQVNNIKIFNTASNGMINFKVTDKGIAITTYRKDLWPFWFAN